MKKLFLLLLLSLFISCKTKSSISGGASSKEDANTVIENYYKNSKDFKTLVIRSNVKYDDNRQTQNVTTEIKIRKDQEILISIRFLGITMAKAHITPEMVSYYEKIGGTYFEGNFDTLSRALGTDLNFTKIQDLLIGATLYDLKTEDYRGSFTDGLYKLDGALSKDLEKSFFFDSEKYLLQKQEIKQSNEKKSIQINYSNYKNQQGLMMPFSVYINAIYQGDKTEINLDHTSIVINEKLTFPYSVPFNYKKISITSF